MDDLFKKWINLEPFDMNDLLTMLLKYNELFNDKEINPNDLIKFIQKIPINWNNVINNTMPLIGRKLNYNWYELYDINGRLIYRFMNE